MVIKTFLPVNDVTLIPWSEPNNFEYKDLHVGDRGSRLATITGVTWLTRSILVAAHHCSGKIGIFNLNNDKVPIKTININTRTDDVTCRWVDSQNFLISCSATWSGEQVLIKGSLIDNSLNLGNPQLIKNLDHSFSHGTFFIGTEPGICFSTGEFPRIQIGDKIITLPLGNLPTTAFYEDKSSLLYICANKYPASQENIQVPSEATIWRFNMSNNILDYICSIDQCHVDKCQIFYGCLWINNQYRDNVTAVNLANPENQLVIKHDSIDFPHGLEINNNGILAVSNYKSECISIFDLKSMIKQYKNNILYTKANDYNE